jgi:hypothetical protein
MHLARIRKKQDKINKARKGQERGLGEGEFCGEAGERWTYLILGSASPCLGCLSRWRG